MATDDVTTKPNDYLGTYIGDLAQIIDMDVIRSARLKLGIDPLGFTYPPYAYAAGQILAKAVAETKSLDDEKLHLGPVPLLASDTEGVRVALAQ